MNEEMLETFEKELKEKYPLGVPRKNIGKVTGGILHPRTCANLDSLKRGIPGRFKIGSRTIYPVSGVVQFLKEKISLNE